MIDTIILSLPKTKIITLDLTTSGVRPWDLQARTQVYDKFVKNPSSRDKQTGRYFPRLTGYKRKNGKLEWESTLKIEFSAPKLIYENNVDELRENQFEAVVEALRDRLGRMGVIITAENLKNAEVRAVHYSKNIELKNGYTSQYVISELGKINLNKRFDLTRARYMNDGQSLYAYTQAHSLVMYDKVADLIRGKKRSTDKEQTAKQLSLFEPLTKREQPREILRMEARLSQKQKLNSLFKQLGFAKDPTFKDVFSVKISKAVLLHYWDTMVAENSVALFAYSLTTKDLLKQVLLARKSAKGKAAIYLTGLLLLAREGSGLRELRTMLAKRTNDRTWYRLVADLREVTADLSKLRPREWYDQIKREFKRYKPFRAVGKSTCPVNKSKVS
jgi:hypothetical protein